MLMRSRSFVPAALTIAVCGAAAFGAQPGAPPTGASVTVFRGGTVITGTGAPALPDAVIVVEGDTITSVGGSATPDPAGATVVDVGGKFIIPGLVESHAHYEEWMGELFLNHGITSAFAIGGNFGPAKQVSQEPESRSPRIFDTAGDPRLNASMDESQVRDSVRAWLKGNPDFARLRDYDEASSRTFAWAADEIHRGGLQVFGHTMNAPESVRAGHDVIEHMWGFIFPTMTVEERAAFREGRYLHWSLFLRDWPELERLMRDAVSRGAAINPTLVYELGSLSAHAERHEREVLALNSDPSLSVYYPPNIAQSLLQKQRQIRNFAGRYENMVRLSRLTADERREFARGYALAGEFLRRFVALGGKVQAGTDTVSGGTPGLSLHHELQLLVEAGLTPMQALQSATGWSAELIAGRNGERRRPRIGTIGEGALADLVVLSADPLEAIANTTRIERVMKGGKFVTPGYSPAYYSFSRPPRSISMATPEPALSAIEPHTVIEGSPTFTLTVHGVGFVAHSVVRVDGVARPTTFVNPRTLTAMVPASVVRSATPNPFDAPGPTQHSGVFGDVTVPVTVFNAPPEGGVSNAIALRLRAKWMGLDDQRR